MRELANGSVIHICYTGMNSRLYKASVGAYTKREFSTVIQTVDSRIYDA